MGNGTDKVGQVAGVLLAPILICVQLLAVGCGGAQEAKTKLGELEREVARLRAERANLSARNNRLGDKLLVVAKKAESCEQRQHKDKLRVVRLAPQVSQPVIQPVVEGPRTISAKPNAKSIPGRGPERPVLTLYGLNRPLGRPGGQPLSRLESSESFTSTTRIQADNLGVVSPAEGVSLGPSSPSPVGPMELFNEAYRAFSNKRYAEAMQGFSRFVKEQGGHGFADNALFWRGECYLALGKMLEAIGEFERVLARYPRSEKGPSALYRIGFAYDQLRDKERAREYYFKVVDRYPGTDAARRASRRVGSLDNRGSGAKGILPTMGRR
jgi:tol-pal system protein YbgF